MEWLYSKPVTTEISGLEIEVESGVGGCTRLGVAEKRDASPAPFGFNSLGKSYCVYRGEYEECMDRVNRRSFAEDWKGFVAEDSNVYPFAGQISFTGELSESDEERCWILKQVSIQDHKQGSPKGLVLPLQVVGLFEELAQKISRGVRFINASGVQSVVGRLSYNANGEFVSIYYWLEKGGRKTLEYRDDIPLN